MTLHTWVEWTDTLHALFSVLVLFGVFPAAMSWSERYSDESEAPVPPIVPGGKLTLSVVMGGALLVIVSEVIKDVMQLQGLHWQSVQVKGYINNVPSDYFFVQYCQHGKSPLQLASIVKSNQMQFAVSSSIDVELHRSNEIRRRYLSSNKSKYYKAHSPGEESSHIIRIQRGNEERE